MLKNLQNALKNNQTDAESKFWRLLRSRSLKEFKFKRQHVLQGYTVDFVCLKKKLIVELEERPDDTTIANNETRTQKLQRDGFKILRFSSNDVLNNLEDVWEVIYKNLNTKDTPQSSPSSNEKK